MTLKIALCIRKDGIKYRGGDTIQALQTSKALRKFGVKTDVIFGVPKENRYHIIHAFNLTRAFNTFDAFNMLNQISEYLYYHPYGIHSNSCRNTIH
jgi:hypothetical protein